MMRATGKKETTKYVNNLIEIAKLEQTKNGKGLKKARKK